MRVLCLLDASVQPGDYWLWNYLPSHGDEVDFVTGGAGDKYGKWGKLLSYYPRFVLMGFKAMAQISRKSYDIVVAWEGKNGFSLALLRSLLGKRRPKMVILVYNQRGIITYFPAITRFALKSVDRVVVITRWEEAHLSRQLGIPQSKITFCPLGWYGVEQPDAALKEPPAQSYIFSSGRSHRDYKTFAAALEGIREHVIINARPFNLRGVTFPANVEINDMLPVDQFWKLLLQSRFVVIPLQKIDHASGESVILQAMSAGKAIIATRAPGPETYVEEGVTGLLVPPQDPRKLREALQYLLDHPEEAERMGRNARRRFEEQYTFAALAERVHGILEEVCGCGDAPPASATPAGIPAARAEQGEKSEFLGG